ncbi:flagellar biosynthesis chaperone FliJ [Mycoplasmoides fastidiosum]|uniref:Flagellar biosynthesis chaperone FliJ n=1 Tax=Mycoplasmoides fastidiosum TaxID=92758 RepID=A0ABU0LZ38_9BACT|nr:hypothetical protein [Mycoplasmoides fastidiosum]MDQ0513966.1 flagellar biosynthesis chaperone FliJ [Mycoplasmoides fastidiosum]UUD37620.1 hypothetical protein NPA10_03570 [Mycoplasmoides fastidiosum]
MGNSSDQAANSSTASIHSLVNFLQSAVQTDKNNPPAKNQKPDPNYTLSSLLNAVSSAATTLTTQLNALANPTSTESLSTLKTKLADALVAYTNATSDNQEAKLQALLGAKNKYQQELSSTTQKYLTVANATITLDFATIKLNDFSSQEGLVVLNANGRSQQNQEALENLLIRTQDQFLNRSNSDPQKNFNSLLNDLINQNRAWNQLTNDLKVLTLNRSLTNENQAALSLLNQNADQLLAELNANVDVNNPTNSSSFSTLLAQLNQTNPRPTVRNISNQTNQYQTFLGSNAWNDLIRDLQAVNQIENNAYLTNQLKSFFSINGEFNQKFTTFYQEWDKFQSFINTLQSIKEHYQAYQTAESVATLRNLITSPTSADPEIAKGMQILKEILGDISTRVFPVQKNTLKRALEQLVLVLANNNNSEALNRLLEAFASGKIENLRIFIGSQPSTKTNTARDLFQQMQTKVENLISSADQEIKTLTELFRKHQDNSVNNPQPSVNHSLAEAFNNGIVRQ